MQRITWLGSIALLCSPIVVWSQETGSRVRVTEGRSGGEHHTGTVIPGGPDSVALKLDRTGETVAYPFAGISRLEVSRGRKGHVLTGALLGLLGGAGVGALVGSSSCGICSGEDNDNTLAAVVGGGVGAGIGLVVGALVGGSMKSDRWEAVPPDRWRVGAWLPGPGRFGLALSLRF